MRHHGARLKGWFILCIIYIDDAEYTLNIFPELYFRGSFKCPCLIHKPIPGTGLGATFNLF